VPFLPRRIFCLRVTQPCVSFVKIHYKMRGWSSCSDFRAQWLFYAPPVLKIRPCTFCPHSVFMCFVWISEQTAIISLYSINWLVCITETQCVHCAVRTGSLYIISPVVTVRTARFNIQQFHVLPTQCIYVFFVDLRTNSDYFPTQH
jgi:hypothetical protein